MVKRVYFGAVANDHVRDAGRHRHARVRDARRCSPSPVLSMGLYPKPFTDVMHASVAELLRHVAVSKIAP